ncbi:MAG: hypothetical protein C0433_11605 [Cyclobacterium sp.]|nr:hypothetical protein [Cyclobacterium sp.]
MNYDVNEMLGLEKYNFSSKCIIIKKTVVVILFSGCEMKKDLLERPLKKNQNFFEIFTLD